MAEKRLCLDIGNSRVKAAIYRDNLEIEYFPDLSSDQLSLLLNQSDRTLVSKTGSRPEMEIMLSGIPNVHFLSAKSNLPVDLDYQSKDTLGSDRIAASVGAFNSYPDQNILILDAGTCITLDLLDAKGVYRGGMISPGIAMRFKAMNEFTANLPLVKTNTDVTFPGKTSTESMQVGVYQSIVNELKGYFDSLIEQYEDLIIVDCSGMSIHFEKATNYKIFAQPKLVLLGLNVIADYNA